MAMRSELLVSAPRRRTISNPGTVPCSIGYIDDQGQQVVLARLAPGESIRVRPNVDSGTDGEPCPVVACDEAGKWTRSCDSFISASLGGRSALQAAITATRQRSMMLMEMYRRAHRDR